MILTPPSSAIATTTGYSLSPGGLLLPYHFGALDALAASHYVDDTTPLAGSSAGAIAAAVHVCQVDSELALEAAITVGTNVFRNPLIVASGGLLAHLTKALDRLLPRDAHVRVNERPGVVVLAHRQLYPNNQAILQTQFDTREDLMNAICASSMFPYFLTNRPALSLGKTAQTPFLGGQRRLVVDGLFACPWQRMGCPDFNEVQDTGAYPTTALVTTSTPLSTKSALAEVNKTPRQRPDRTVLVAPFPTGLLTFSTTRVEYLLGPDLELTRLPLQTTRLFRLATQGGTRRELRELYQEGWRHAHEWVQRDQQRQQQQQLLQGPQK